MAAKHRPTRPQVYSDYTTGHIEINLPPAPEPEELAHAREHHQETTKLYVLLMLLAIHAALAITQSCSGR